MKDILQDIVSHTQNLGFLTTVKVTGTEEKTTINSMADDRSVIMEAETVNPYPDMLGVFGMPQFNKLKYLLDGAEYKDDAKISITTAERNGDVIPVGIHFENKDSDFKNDYRFMSTALVNDKLKKVTFKEPTWDLEFEPTIAGIQRLKMQAQANSEEPLFTAKSENNDLMFYFGDHSTHAGNFVFHPSAVGNKLTRAWSFPVKQVISILDLVGDKKIHFSSQGAAMITVDSGIAVYKYILPAQTK